MNTGETVVKNFLEKFPKWIAIPATIFFAGIAVLANIEDSTNLLKRIKMEWMLTTLNILALIGEIFFPVLIIYLILVIGALKTKLEKSVSNFSDEIKRIDEFQDSVIPHTRKMQAQILMQMAFITELINKLAPKQSEDQRKEIKKNALEYLLKAVYISCATPLHIGDLKVYIHALQVAISNVPKEYLHEISVVSGFDIDDILSELTKLDTSRALASEIAELKNDLYKLRKV
jgi:hypothetical protein